ncbi:MAG: SDR family NAD(P)-dependent oxidoreductase [Candidatus Amulumruptor caecigallinarius]|nr:SDR family NAD(P)-dependent oxidoreductase [Candidatus Amulumruptor caecigallinarius]
MKSSSETVSENKMEKERRCAIVTGASSGIGLCFCKTLADLGYNLIMVSNQERELYECARNITSEYGVEASPLVCDLTNRNAVDEITRLADMVAVKPSILINNAGIFSFSNLLDTPDRKIECFIDLHVRSVTELSKAFAARFKHQGGGYILNMSSLSCWTPMPGIAMYSATKAYIRVFTRALHYEMRDYGVHVMAACPGGIATNLFGISDKLMKIAVAIGAVQTPEKFTRKAIKHLLNGKMQYINGFINRIAIAIVGIAPTSVRMMIKHRMLDKGITR